MESSLVLVLMCRFNATSCMINEVESDYLFEVWCLNKENLIYIYIYLFSGELAACYEYKRQIDVLTLTSKTALVQATFSISVVLISCKRMGDFNTRGHLYVFNVLHMCPCVGHNLTVGTVFVFFLPFFSVFRVSVRSYFRAFVQPFQPCV